MKVTGDLPSKKKVLLTQPNYSRHGRRTWRLLPYAIGIVNASINRLFNTEIFDPNFDSLDDSAITSYLKQSAPDLVGISTISTEYLLEIEHMTALVRKALPDVVIVEGGVLPTVAIDTAMRDHNVDFWIIGEGEKSFPALLNQLDNSMAGAVDIPGVAYFKDNRPLINLPKGFIEDLDSVPFADYGNLDFVRYSRENIKYAQGARARQYPYAMTITSRGCPYRCVFCSGPRISGRKVRMRSAENVLEEIDLLYSKGIKEIIFADDHFYYSRQRAIEIMRGLIERNYDLLWKCVNLTVWLLDAELLDLMQQSGCYQMTVSIESGNQHVLNKYIKKPCDLSKVPDIINAAKSRGIEIIANFVIGFPDETWDQIRDTFAYAERLDVDLVNFHIATPLPNTELMETCIERGYLSSTADEEVAAVGYTKGVISTDEFSPEELQIVRAFEWDRINFRTPERKQNVARIQGISLEELERWRKDTRRSIGIASNEVVAYKRS